MPAIQSYSTLNYSNYTLHYVVIFAGLCYPLGCAIAMLIETRSLIAINALTLIGTIIAVFIFYVAVMSPNVPFNFTIISSVITVNIGSLISVLSWSLYTLILSYVKTIITIMLNEDKGEDALFWVGMMTQVRST